MTRTATLALTVLLLFVPSMSSAHDIPADVTVLMFVKPEPGHVRVLVRVPLGAMRDIKFPALGPGYLDIPHADSTLQDAARIWIAGYVEVYADGAKLGEPRIVEVRAALPSDRSFASYDEALAHLSAAPLGPNTQIIWQQAMLDVLLEYPGGSEAARISIHPALAHLGLTTRTVLRFTPPGRGERAYQYTGDPGVVHLDPRWHQAAWQFVKLGFGHIMSGIDHLLFVLCLVIPVRRMRPLVAIITSFTAAHSITLAASVLGFAPGALWFPPLIETLIAASILYMALENIAGPRLERRWLIAFGFGLVHGFGFSFVLRESLQFAGSHLATSLLSFNLGVELGQLFVLALAIPLLSAVYQHLTERMGIVILSALVGHTAWHWMVDRFATLRGYRVTMPVLDTAFLAGTIRALMLGVLLAGALWALSGLFGKLLRASSEQETHL